MTNIDTEAVIEVATKAAECEQFCCTRKQTPDEIAARKAKRALSYDNAVRLLHFAEKAAMEGNVGEAKAFVEIAGQWDSIGY